MGFGDIVGYIFGRTITKIVLILSAIAISTFAFGGIVYDMANYEFFLKAKDWLAIAIFGIILLIKDHIIEPKIPLLRLDVSTNKIIFYILLGLVGLAISSINFKLIDDILNIELYNVWFTIRNIIAVVLLYAARKIHVSG